jgi:hypothetical protein
LKKSTESLIIIVVLSLISLFVAYICFHILNSEIQISKTFEFRNIIKMIKTLEIDFFKQNKDMFYPLITEYSELSTFVHAGASRFVR